MAVIAAGLRVSMTSVPVKTAAMRYNGLRLMKNEDDAQ
jgi:hypothetical protein